MGVYFISFSRPDLRFGPRKNLVTQRNRQCCRQKQQDSPAKRLSELDGKQNEWFSGYDARLDRVSRTARRRIVRFIAAAVSDDLDSVRERIRVELRLLFD